MVKKRHLKKKYKIILVIITIITFLLLWSRFISTSGLLIKEYKVANVNIPTSFEGLKIVHLTDVHYGRTININRLKYIVKEINALKPDLILFTGDLIDKDIVMTNQIKSEITTSLNQLNASIGKYAISGNHDLQFEEYDNIIKDSGFINLNNAYDIIYSPSYETIYIAGLESEIAGNPIIENVTKYLEQDNDATKKHDIPPYKILLLHTPDSTTKLKTNEFDLIVAGHSHNGQVRLPFIGAIIKPIGAKKYFDSYYKINNTDLYISGGLGTSNINFRFFNKPSFNFYRLLKK